LLPQNSLVVPHQPHFEQHWAVAAQTPLPTLPPPQVPLDGELGFFIVGAGLGGCFGVIAGMTGVEIVAVALLPPQWTLPMPHQPHFEQHCVVFAQTPLPTRPAPQVPLDDEFETFVGAGCFVSCCFGLVLLFGCGVGGVAGMVIVVSGRVVAATTGGVLPQ
jgi:hypothetical protein